MNWFKLNCNGDWEHSNSITIETLDNPGWAFKVDITDTNDEGKTLLTKEIISDDNWYDINCDGAIFEAFGDLSKLPFLIEQFRNLVNK